MILEAFFSQWSIQDLIWTKIVSFRIVGLMQVYNCLGVKKKKLLTLRAFRSKHLFLHKCRFWPFYYGYRTLM